MPSLFAPFALLGESLTLTRDVLISFDDSGVITSISRSPLSRFHADYILPPSSLLLPGFINSHVHVGDAFLKDAGLGLPLSDVVGPEGIKHHFLGSSSDSVLLSSIRNSLSLLVDYGFTTFVDFRELGLKGIKLLRSVLPSYPLRAVILSRPYLNDDLNTLLLLSDGFGFSDIFSLDSELLLRINSLLSRYPSKFVGIHVSETEDLVQRSFSQFGTSDLQFAFQSLSKLDFIVHANYASLADINFLSRVKASIICCPVSNVYYGLRFPPISSFLNAGLLVALGTDNVLTSPPSPFKLMSFTILFSNYLHSPLSPLDALKLVTVNAGKIFSLPIGQIALGYSADFIGLDLASNDLEYSRDVYTAVTLRAERDNIIFQMFKGQKVK